MAAIKESCDSRVPLFLNQRMKVKMTPNMRARSENERCDSHFDASNSCLPFSQTVISSPATHCVMFADCSAPVLHLHNENIEK